MRGPSGQSRTLNRPSLVSWWRQPRSSGPTIARGVLAGLNPMGYEIINLGGHETVTINELLLKIEERLGKKANIEYIPRHPADADANWANVDKARRLLGWQPQVTLDLGITALVDWYLENRSWASQVLTP